MPVIPASRTSTGVMTIPTNDLSSRQVKRKRNEDRELGSKARAFVALAESRLGTRASHLLVTHVNKVELDDELVSLDEYVLTDLAHAVMLTRTGIFDPKHGSSIVGALLDLRAGDTFALLDPRPEVGTLGLQIEQYLERCLGPHGRDIQRARSRIDQKHTNWRLVNRAGLVNVIDELISLGHEILTAAARYQGALMPGYTHLQHSQPTTIDHYLNAHYWSVSRNLGRLLDAYDRLNVSPLGGAAYSGTSWPIDRDITAYYLGFDNPIANARDAGFASLDMGAEIAGVLASTLSGISRLASDFNYWASSEVSLMRVGAALCGTSSMMPQKRNPMTLERIRGLAGVAAGWSASQFGVMHMSTSTDVDQAYVHDLLPGQCAETVGAISLLREILATAEFDLPAMRASAGRHWSTASALADALVASQSMSFRDAHENVAHLVASHERAGVGNGEIRADLITGAAFAGYSSSELETILDTECFVATRTSQGGTSVEERKALATTAVTDLNKIEQEFHQRKGHIAKGLEQLLEHAKVIVDS